MAQRSAVVTGAAMGIGRATAARLLRDGWAVVGLDRDGAALRAAAAEIGFAAVEGDIVDAAAHEAAADAAERLAPLAGWGNNAAIDIQGAAHEVSDDDLDRGLRVLLAGPMLGTRTAVRRMLAAGGGSIVQLASIQGVVAFPRYFVYGAAKAALIQTARSVATDYGPHGIRCNAILPGSIFTPMTLSVLDPSRPLAEELAREGELSPSGKIGQPEQVAAAIAWLLSDDASYVSGAALPVDGAAIARCYAYPTLAV
jgi:NAD(P)-dependent dehydrogenase (short-subunit alcohol dehydrogenase family)